MSACGHYPSRHSLHTPNFRGAVDALVECIYTISGVGTASFTIDPSGYAANFEGLVQVIEDLNWTLSGVNSGGSVIAGSGIYTTTSGAFTVVNAAIEGGSGIYVTYSGRYAFINATVLSTSGVAFTAGSGLYLSDGGTKFNLGAYGEGSTTVTYNGSNVAISGRDTPITVSGNPAPGYGNGSLWFDTTEGRLFVYASGNGTAYPAWYQTNAEAFAVKGEVPPSGAGLNSPPRDGQLWFNNLLGSLFIYDATTSGWYETGPSRSFAYSSTAPSPSVEGAGWLDSSVSVLKVWNGSTWITV
jgi:hypothetical protein